jgi:transcriptional regulator with GAF, ATPase, and Fis domain
MSVSTVTTTSSAPAPYRPRMTIAQLGARLRELATAVGADTLDVALRAVLEATGARAGALCQYEQRDEVLTLVHHVGLADEGARRLQQVRKGAIVGWDMPLHALLNHRVYLIENAAKNRYVPPLVEPSSTMRAVACLPLQAGPAPVGTLVLVAFSPGFGEHTVQALVPHLRDLAHLLQAVSGSAPTTVVPKAAAPAAATPAHADDALHRLQEENERLLREVEQLKAEQLALEDAYTRLEDAIAREAADRSGVVEIDVVSGDERSKTDS